MPMKKQGKRYKNKHLFQKRLSERLDINKICGGFINKIMTLTKRH